MIVKVQRPLSSNDPNAPCLVYDEGRRHQGFIELTPEEVVTLMGDAAKGYFEARVERGNLVLGERVADRDW